MGLGMCKGLCNADRNFPTSKYYTHYYCRSCSWWMEQKYCVGKNKNRCPCCKILVSTRPRNSKAKGKYRMIKNGR